MSAQATLPSLMQVTKVLAREWRSAVERSAAEKEPRTHAAQAPDRPRSKSDQALHAKDVKRAIARMKKSQRMPIWTLRRLISKATSISEHDIEWMAWYSDTPLALTPEKQPHATFFTPDPELEAYGLPEDYATGDVLKHLQMIHEELTKCDADGRTADILARLTADHPGVLNAVGLTRPKGTVGGRRKRRKRKKKVGAAATTDIALPDSNPATANESRQSWELQRPEAPPMQGSMPTVTGDGEGAAEANKCSKGIAYVTTVHLEKRRLVIKELAQHLNVGRQALYENAEFAELRSLANKLFGLFGKERKQGDWDGARQGDT